MAEQMDEYHTTSVPGGTYHAMSPEMACLYKAKLNKQEPDYSALPSFESDLWAVGILSVELASKTKLKPF